MKTQKSKPQVGIPEEAVLARLALPVTKAEMIKELEDRIQSAITSETPGGSDDIEEVPLGAIRGLQINRRILAVVRASQGVAA
jgi:hypothetical protein